MQSMFSCLHPRDGSFLLDFIVHSESRVSRCVAAFVPLIAASSMSLERGFPFLTRPEPTKRLSFFL